LSLYLVSYRLNDVGAAGGPQKHAARFRVRHQRCVGAQNLPPLVQFDLNEYPS
jgi:hypothetical protein